MSPAGTSRLSLSTAGRRRRGRPSSPRGTRPRAPLPPARCRALALLHRAPILPVRRPRYRTQRIRSRRVERARNPWWVLIGSCTGLFVLMLDSTVVTLALPAIRSDLDASLDSLQWIQNAYLLTLTAAVVTAGRLGDLRGRRRVFVIGMAIFAAGSLLAGAAGSAGVLIAGPGDPGDRRGGAALALAGADRGRLPAREPRPRARDLGGGLGDRARDRAGGRRRPDRARQLALDLLRQRAGDRRRGRDPARSRLGVARRDRLRADRPGRRRRARRRPDGDRLRPGRGRRLGLGFARDARPARRRDRGPDRLLAARAQPRGAPGRLQPVPQPALSRRQRRRLRPRRRLLDGDVLRAPVPAAGARPTRRPPPGR